MKKFISACVLLLLAFSGKAQLDTTRSGLLYGYNHAFYLTAPVGWIMDTESGKDMGITAVFYPQGSSWADGETVMYTTFTSFDTTKNETLKDVLRYDSVQYKTSSPNIRITQQKSVPVGKGRMASVWSYSGDVNGNYELVAYIPEHKGVTMIIISSRSKNGCTNNYRNFESLVKSYRFLTDQVNIQLGK